MLFYENGDVYDTEDGSCEKASRHLLAKAKKLGIQIMGLNGDKNWRDRNKLKLKALSGIDLHSKTSGIIDDLTYVDISGNTNNRITIILSHYLRAIRSLSIEVPCDVVLDDTLILLDNFNFNYFLYDFTIDLSRLNISNKVVFISALAERLDLLGITLFSKPAFIKLNTEGYMSVLLYVLFDACFRGFNIGVNYDFCRKTFEPYLSTMSDIIIELYEHDTDALVYHTEVHDLINALCKIEFCSIGYFHCLVDYFKEYNVCRNYSNLAVRCSKLVNIFGDLPDNLRGFLMELQHTL